MTDRYYPQVSSPAYLPVHSPDARSHPEAVRAQAADTTCSTSIRLGLLGGLIAGSAAAATNLRRARDGEVQTGPALAATARSAAIGAAATATAGAVAGALTEQGLMRLGIMFAVGTAVVYGFNQWGRKSQEAADV